MTKITLYQAFCTEYPFITISEENFNKAYRETHTTNLDHLKDHILSNEEGIPTINTIINEDYGTVTIIYHAG